MTTPAHPLAPSPQPAAARGGGVLRLDPVPLGGHRDEDTAVVACTGAGGERLLRNVTVPTLTPHLPDPATRTGTGVVIAPGGALHVLAADHEGDLVAQRLAERGIAAFVLHYRLVPTPTDEEGFAAAMRRIGDRDHLAEVSRAQRPQALADGGAALRLVRENAAAWHVDPDRVGALGFSAGGYVSLVTTLDGTAEERPSFLGAVYPAWWGEVALPQPAPPLFLAWAADDELGDAVVGSCLRLQDAWRRGGLQVEVHAYARGGHGFGALERGTTSDGWFDAFVRWVALTTG
ncbi:alpha/beta hydrolase [Paenibacillus sp. TRM 82003]|uniref:alpha/beta hydrolase n=1 Tax=Kineococcus sp. TRM81007 TaxID=2925831 RepID=UPI001F58AD27|nr:alpha/beta hydrolase [Kineococcus sp. TRM81007]MCI2238131.1 alpha/beta hydrolase [Kineococcus sp. TRM81007]MCI3920515.1 alpha/beta hydrolase [Paenibacillus sp. TRM 82003]